jgi:DNA anti-recombination protein RmuC
MKVQLDISAASAAELKRVLIAEQQPKLELCGEFTFAAAQSETAIAKLSELFLSEISALKTENALMKQKGEQWNSQMGALKMGMEKLEKRLEENSKGMEALNGTPKAE